MDFDEIELIRLPEGDGLTIRCYYNLLFFVAFDTHDGHLAYIMSRQSYQYIYKCKCIKKGQRIMGIRFEDEMR